MPLLSGPLGATASVVLGGVVGSFLNMAIYRLPRRAALADVRAERLRLERGGPPAGGAVWRGWADDVPALPAHLRDTLRRARTADQQRAALRAAEQTLSAAVSPRRSYCPHCRHTLAVPDLIPVLSYLALRGRCRHCDARIAPRYLVVELLTVGVFLAVWWVIQGAGDPWWALDLAVYGVFGAVLVAVVFIDLEHRIIPHELVLVGLLVGVGRDLVGLLTHRYPPWLLSDPTGVFPGAGLPLPPSLVGMVIGFVFFAAIDVFGRVVFRREEAMGGGDANFAAAIGAVLGPWPALLSFGAAVVGGGVLGAGAMAVWALRSGLKGAVGHYIPFGPFLAVTAFASMLLVAAIGVGGVLAGLQGAWEWWVGVVAG